jgi:hypothetical protein
MSNWWYVSNDERGISGGNDRRKEANSSIWAADCHCPIPSFQTRELDVSVPLISRRCKSSALTGPLRSEQIDRRMASGAETLRF